MLSKLALAIGIVASLNTASFALDNGEELFMQKCAVCHVMQRPQSRADMVAPPAKGLMFHMTKDIGSDEKILAHIKSFTINPTKDKAICRSVRRFGLMPSQKDNITDAELDTVAHWMIENLKMTQEEYNNRTRMGGQGRPRP